MKVMAWPLLPARPVLPVSASVHVDMWWCECKYVCVLYAHVCVVWHRVDICVQ